MLGNVSSSNPCCHVCALPKWSQQLPQSTVGESVEKDKLSWVWLVCQGW